MDALGSPLQTLKGVGSGLLGVAKGVGGLAMDIPQAFMPTGVKLPWSSGAIVNEGEANPIYSTPSAAPGQLAQRFAKVSNVLGLGIPTQLADNYGKTGTIDDAILQTAKTLLPINEGSALLSGESIENPGTQLSPEELGKVSFDALLKTIPLAKGLKSAGSAFARGTVKDLPQRFARASTVSSEAEIAAEANHPSIARLARQQQLRDLINNAPKDTLPETAIGWAKELSDNISETLTEAGMAPSVTRAFMDMIPDDVLAGQMTSELMNYVAGKSPKLKLVSEHAIELLGTNPVAAESVVEMMRKHGLTPEQTAATMPIILDGLRSTTSNAGKTLKVFSELSQMVTAKILRDSPEAAGHMKKVLEALKYDSEPISRWDKFKNVYSKVEQIWRGAVVSSPVTAARNTTVGGVNFASQLFDAALFGAEKYAAGKISNYTGKLAATEIPTMAQAFEPLMHKLTTMQELAFGGAKSLKQWWEYMQSNPADGKIFTPLDKIINEFGNIFPQEYTRLMNGPVQDLATVNLVADGWKKAIPNAMKAWGEVETLHDAAKFGTSLLNTFNTMQEMFWRKFYFGSRLRDNVRRFGFDTPEDYFANMATKEGSVSKRYFGEAHTAQSLADLRTSGEFAKRVAAQKGYLEDSASAQKGAGLHSVEKNIIGDKHVKLSESIEKAMKKLEADLASGDDWTTASSKIMEPALARVLGGKTEFAAEALTEAVDYSLKQTFAYTPPKGHFGYSIMKMYEELPMLYTLASPFPRFMLNSTQWILEHDPTKLRKVASPKFLETIAKAASDPTSITNPKMMDQFSQAHTGAALWAASYAIHNTGLGGPKYYQVNVGKDDDGNDIFADMRSYNPLVQFMFMDHTFRALSQGQQPNLTSGELTEALLGLRRLGEVPIFALPDLIRQIDSSNPDAFFNSLKPLVGQYMAGALTPFKIGSDLAAAVGVKKAGEYKDMGGNELFGPAVNQVPGLREALPARVDPFTGQPSGQEHPAIRLLGPNLHHATKLEQQVSQTGMPLNDLLGNYADPEADRLVRKNIGLILNNRLENGQSLANVLGEGVARATADQPIEVKRTMIRELYKQIREQAKQQAMAENPYAFIEHEIRQRPEAERPILRKGLEHLNQKKAELMSK